MGGGGEAEREFPDVSTTSATSTPSTPPTVGVQVSGDCNLHSSGTCVSSNGYPNRDYGDDEDCTIQVQPGSTISVENFNTEDSYDNLVVDNSDEYSGSFAVGLNRITATGRITWSTDYGGTRSGWLICFTPPVIVTSGPCIADAAEGICVTSPRYPDEFQATPTGCTLAARPNTYISVEGGNTRSSAVPNNTFVVDGTRVEDGMRLNSVQTQSGLVEWMPAVNTSTKGFTKGWRLCFNREPVVTSGVHVSGDCKLQSSTCVSSNGYPSFNYGNNQDCTIRVRRGSTIYVEEFDTHSSRDVLIVDYSKEYSGDSADGLDGSITTTGRIAWSTGGRYTSTGWLICITPPVTVTSGPCVVDEADARCVTSPQYPDDFQATTAGCTLTARPNAFISVADDQSSALHGSTFIVDGTPVDNGRRLDGRRTKSGLVEWIPTSTSPSSTNHWRICFNYRRKLWPAWTIAMLVTACLSFVLLSLHKKAMSSDQHSYETVSALSTEDRDRLHQQKAPVKIDLSNDAEWKKAGIRDLWHDSNCCCCRCPARWPRSFAVIALCLATGWTGFGYWLATGFQRPYNPQVMGAYEMSGTCGGQQDNFFYYFGGGDYYSCSDPVCNETRVCTDIGYRGTWSTPAWTRQEKQDTKHCACPTDKRTVELYEGSLAWIQQFDGVKYESGPGSGSNDDSIAGENMCTRALTASVGGVASARALTAKRTKSATILTAADR